MKVIVLKNNLKEGVDSLGRLSPDGTSPLPILKNFLLQTQEGKLVLSSTNLEVAITRRVSGKVIDEGGITIPTAIMSSLLSNLGAEKVELQVDNTTLILKTDNYQAKIQGMKQEEFPLIPRIKNIQSQITLPANILLESILFVLNAVHVGAVKPELRGVLFDFESGLLRVAGTDSFRLTEKTMYASDLEVGEFVSSKILVPAKTLYEVVRVFKNSGKKITMEFDETQVIFRDENAEVVSHLVGGEFPDYRAIVPKEAKTEVALNKNDLIQALKLTGSFADRLNEVRVVVKEKAKTLEVVSLSQIGENNYMIPAKIKGEAVEAVFNWRFLIDGLKDLVSDTVVIKLAGDSRPVTITGEDDASYLYLVMPIKAA